MTGTRAELSQGGDVPGPRASAARLAQELCSTEGWPHRGSILGLVTASPLHTSPMSPSHQTLNGECPSAWFVTQPRGRQRVCRSLRISCGIFSCSGLSQDWYFQHSCRILVLQEERGLQIAKGCTALARRGSSFSLLTSELKRSFERASETHGLQKLLELDLTLCGFFYSRAQGCLLNSFLTAHLGFGAAAEQFVSLIWAKWCSGSCVSHPSPAAWLCYPSSRCCLQQLDVAPLPGRAIPGALSPCCALVGIQAEIISVTAAPSLFALFPKKRSDEGLACLEAEDMERLLCLSEPICLILQ